MNGKIETKDELMEIINGKTELTIIYQTPVKLTKKNRITKTYLESDPLYKNIKAVIKNTIVIADWKDTYEQLIERAQLNNGSEKAANTREDVYKSIAWPVVTHKTTGELYFYATVNTKLNEMYTIIWHDNSKASDINMVAFLDSYGPLEKTKESIMASQNTFKPIMPKQYRFDRIKSIIINGIQKDVDLSGISLADFANTEKFEKEEKVEKVELPADVELNKEVEIKSTKIIYKVQPKDVFWQANPLMVKFEKQYKNVVKNTILNVLSASFASGLNYESVKTLLLPSENTNLVDIASHLYNTIIYLLCDFKMSDYINIDKYINNKMESVNEYVDLMGLFKEICLVSFNSDEKVADNLKNHLIDRNDVKDNQSFNRYIIGKILTDEKISNMFKSMDVNFFSGKTKTKADVELDNLIATYEDSVTTTSEKLNANRDTQITMITEIKDVKKKLKIIKSDKLGAEATLKAINANLAEIEIAIDDKEKELKELEASEKKISKELSKYTTQLDALMLRKK